MEKAGSIKNIADVYEKEKSYSIYQNIVLRILSKMSKGELHVTLPDGEELTFGGNERTISAHIKINSPGFFKRIVLYGDIGFGESYVTGSMSLSTTALQRELLLFMKINPHTRIL